MRFVMFDIVNGQGAKSGKASVNVDEITMIVSATVKSASTGLEGPAIGGCGLQLRNGVQILVAGSVDSVSKRLNRLSDLSVIDEPMPEPGGNVGLN